MRYLLRALKSRSKLQPHNRGSFCSETIATKNLAKLVFILFIFLLCVPLSRQGMFVDGVWYAAIAKNMAADLGSIWDPALSKTLFLHFREHPPLNIAIQSLFFTLFGDHFWVERLYSFSVSLVQISLIYLLWQSATSSQAARSSKLRDFTFMLFLWLVVPINIGMYKDNLLEAGLTLFTTLACLVLIKPFATNKSFLIHSTLAAFFMIAGFMCNGPTALFPLAIPFLYHYFLLSFSANTALKQTFILCCITALCFLIFFMLFPAALSNIQGYFKVQLMAAITGQRDLSFTGWKHFYIFYIYLKDYIWLAAAALVLMTIDARLNHRGVLNLCKQYAKNPWFRFYFVLSLCASLPVGISHRQMFHYISASSPIIVLAIMHLCSPSFKNLLSHIKSAYPDRTHKRTGQLLNLLSIASIISLELVAGGYNKNQKLIEDVQKVAKFLPNSSIIKGSDQIMGYFDVPANFARYSFISFIDKTKVYTTPSKYYIYYPNENLPANYQPIELGLSYFKLGKKV